MVDSFNIGLNLTTALLINFLIFAAAVVFTLDVQSAAARIARGLLSFVLVTLLILIVFSLPHASVL
ncbi:hypothetical protein U1708_07995 [Sphingomonas sp. ZB1N12]|uniref:hypothetical protein n=1 Tax=Sphingomonas arabinosi TaxID=3096160 RepID=UPI002FCB2EF7